MLANKVWSMLAATAVAASLATAAVTSVEAAPAPVRKLPWAAAGLDQRQAAAHLLDRFAFGPRPGDIERVVAMGLEAWLEAQLTGAVDDTRFAERVQPLDAWQLSADQINRTFPPFPVVRREAIEAGLIAPDAPLPDPQAPPDDDAMASQRRAIQQLFREKGYRPQRELVGQLVTHKLLQAVYSERQLEAVLVDFWFNHFNVSLTDNQARGYLLSFERDAIAPGVLGRFEDLLAEVAAHPAMLFYLDNAQSTANPGAATTVERQLASAGVDPRGGFRGPGGATRRGGDGIARPQQDRRPPAGRNRGLNENYGRELLELHTLGVDGGYTQDDVIAVARAFTGWSALPPGGLADQMAARMERMERIGGAQRLGFVTRAGGFVFRADAHDAEPKVVLGHELPGGRGIEDGLEVLHLVAQHPSTARHLAAKIAARFVSDQPPPALVERLARRYDESGGDLREVMRELAYSPELWSAGARRAKIKSPFELAASALRALDAEVAPRPMMAAMPGPGGGPRGGRPAGLAEWIERMGQPLYAYQAPTGFPDRAEAWVSTGSLLARMNFGLHLATGRVAGVRVELAALGPRGEPESLEQALATYAALLLPERDLGPALRHLEPMVRHPELGGLVERAAAAAPPAAATAAGAMADGRGDERLALGFDDGADDDRRPLMRMADAAGPGTPTGAADLGLGQVVGVILGSPEFQRR